MPSHFKHNVLLASCALLAFGLAAGGASAKRWRRYSSPAGRARAFHLRASSPELAGGVRIYVGVRNTAHELVAGLYNSVDGHPARLLSAGAAPASSAGSWTAVPIAPVQLVAGGNYWLAILAEGGTFRSRQRTGGVCPSQISAARNLTALPNHWATGATRLDCLVAAHLTASASSPPTGAGLPSLVAGSGLPPLGAAAPSPSTPVETQPPLDKPGPPPLPPPPAPVATTLPAISGEAVEGQPLEASSGTWTESPTSYEYQWENCDTKGENCDGIVDATSSGYTPVANDVGHKLRVTVTATNEGGSTEASSTATAVIAPAPTPPVNKVPPSIDGPAEEGQLLSAHTGSWTGDPTSYEYQWEACTKAGASCAEITDAISPSYTPVAGDVGHTLRVTVTATNDMGPTKATSADTPTVVSQPVAGPQIYVSQSGAGDQSGESCATAHSRAWLDNGSNWGAGGVEPGVTVSLCGTISEPIETHGSGSDGKPIALYFTSGAKIAMGGQGCPGSGCVNVAANSEYITIDGGSGGVIEDTDSGTGKQSPAATTGIQANGCKHCTIDNLTIANLYVPKKGTQYGDTEDRGIYMQEGTAEYVTIAHDTFSDMGWAVNVESAEHSSNIAVEYNTFHAVTHGFTPTATFNGGSIGPVSFAHNYFYGNLEWEDGATDTNHVDGVHCFSADAQGYTPHYTGLYIYDNYIEVEGDNVTAPIFLEGGSGGGTTPCADKTSNIWIFNNVLWATHQNVEGGNGLLGAFSGEPHIYNNTLIGQSNGQGKCEEYNSVAQKIHYENNLATTCKTLIYAEKARFETKAMAHNLWANGGNSGEAFICENPGRQAFGLEDFSGWKSCIGGSGVEEGSKTAATAKLTLSEANDTEGKPEAGSVAIGAGANLAGLCKDTPEEALCAGIDGEARPTSGAWDIGAY
jgi:hypothetical protein